MELSRMLLLLITYFASFNIIASQPLEQSASKWTTFDWNITLTRGRQDVVHISGVDFQQSIDIAGATCNNTMTNSSPLDDENTEFEVQCRCDSITSTFSPDFKICVPNEEIRQGCQLTAGSYQWSTGWSWDRMDDVLMVLDTWSNTSSVITTAYNVTTMDYKLCTLESICEWKDGGSWSQINSTHVTNIQPMFFKNEHFWHISWDVEKMSNEGKNIIEGKILKLMIKCERINDKEKELTSCLVLKVSGSLQITSNFKPTTKPSEKVQSAEPTKATSSSTTTEVLLGKLSSKDNKKTIIIVVLIIIFVILVVMLVILLCWCSQKEKACFAKERSVPVEEPETQKPMLNEQGESVV